MVSTPLFPPVLSQMLNEYRKDGSMEKNEKKKKDKIYVRYDEGAEMYSMCKHSFMKLAAEAHAVYKINRLTLVNRKVFEEYLLIS